MAYLQQVSSGTEGETRYEAIDEKKRRRMASNRESAKRSRRRRQQRLEDLIREVDHLQRSNNEIIAQIDDFKQRLSPIDTENNVLQAQTAELTARLNYLNTVISNLERNIANPVFATLNNGGISHAGPAFPNPTFDEYQDFGEFLMDAPDPLLKPWQSSCSSQPIMASASMFRF